MLDAPGQLAPVGVVLGFGPVTDRRVPTWTRPGGTVGALIVGYADPADRGLRPEAGSALEPEARRHRPEWSMTFPFEQLLTWSLT